MRQIRDVTEEAWLKESEPPAVRDAHRQILVPWGGVERDIRGQAGSFLQYKYNKHAKEAQKDNNPEQSMVTNGHHFTGEAGCRWATPPWTYNEWR